MQLLSDREQSMLSLTHLKLYKENKLQLITSAGYKQLSDSGVLGVLEWKQTLQRHLSINKERKIVYNQNNN